MLLVADVGNTETTLGLCEGEVVTDHWRITTEANRTPDEVFVLLKNLLAANGIASERVTAASPPVAITLGTCARGHSRLMRRTMPSSDSTAPKTTPARTRRPDSPTPRPAPAAAA